jgi:hypothetical protein
MSDIVERLLTIYETDPLDDLDYFFEWIEKLCCEAAADIERLRNDLEWMIKLHGWTPQPEES